MESLFAEQTGQCVYCGRRILLEAQQYHIEHFRPRSKYPQLAFDYSNLFLSCGPEKESGVQNTCGHFKGNWFKEDCHISPVPESCAERFQFRSSGEIAGDSTPEADKMIEVLYLNHPELVTERQIVIEDLEQELSQDVPPDELHQGYMDLDDKGARPGFANVAIGYLEAQNRKGT